MSKKFLIPAIIVNTLGMVVLTLYLMKLPWLAGDEKFLIWSTSLIKSDNLELSPSDEFALINTSYDLQLIDRIDAFGFPVGNQAITDRLKLAQLLEVLNASDNPPKYIICDIHFIDSSAFDDALQLAIDNTGNLIISKHLTEEGEVDSHLFKEAEHGISDYVIGSVFDGVYKYQLIYQDSLKLLPLKLHENLSGERIEKWGPFVKIGDRWTLNNFIMNYRVLQKDIYDFEAGFNPVNLGELLYLEDHDIQEFAADKIVIIGDFYENDMHETIFEITSGPLILLNAYLTIKNGDTKINLLFFVILMVIYAYLSYMAFSTSDPIEKLISKLSNSNVSNYLAGFTSYFLILTLTSIVTFFAFNVHLNAFFLAIAIYILDRVVHVLSRKRNA